jgi:hypothetical protein
MSKKDEKQQQQDYLENYRNLVQRLHTLSRLSVRQLMGTRPTGDPQTDYMTGLEAFKNLANVHLEVLMELTIKKLGMSKEDFLKLQAEQLAGQITAMEQDLCVTGWDGNGNPIFDLAKYAERTALWPK